ncbi:unnamed protein product [Owenia fusiformis]|uniref:Uncharacterized protein n=1 Tax=Owenia fusiformis TaxID=6347 RepID=A0A8S4PNY7_OWEFU|nr:unnamed protein product [Owenia fusiformis]
MVLERNERGRFAKKPHTPQKQDQFESIIVANGQSTISICVPRVSEAQTLPFYLAFELNTCALLFMDAALEFDRISMFFRRDDIALERTSRAFRDAAHNERRRAEMIRSYLTERGMCLEFPDVPTIIPDPIGNQDWTLKDAFIYATDLISQTRECVNQFGQIAANPGNNDTSDAATVLFSSLMERERLIVQKQVADLFTEATYVDPSDSRQWVFDSLANLKFERIKRGRRKSPKAFV